MDFGSIHIIAEAGTNHNGSLEKAKNLVDIAKLAGADSVKFQIIYPEGLYLPGTYKYGHYDIKKVIKIRQDSMLSDVEYEELFAYAKEKKISFSASVFDRKGLDLLDSLNPTYIKIASCDLNNIRFLIEVAEKNRKMVLSTGMSTLKDIEKSLKTLDTIGFDDIVLLHCVSVYPAQLSETNLSYIHILKKEFGYPVGFSDHTANSIAACMALAMGATWFEKHFTEDCDQDGFDHAYALEQDDLYQFVEDVRNANQSLQNKSEKIGEGERYTRQRARRSLYANRDLRKGEIISDQDVLIVRPEGVLAADQVFEVVGRKLKQDVIKYQALTMDVLF